MFLFQRAQTAVPRLQILNPNVNVVADTDNVEEKPDDFFQQFSVICATCCSLEFLVSLISLFIPLPPSLPPLSLSFFLSLSLSLVSLIIAVVGFVSVLLKAAPWQSLP